MRIRPFDLAVTLACAGLLGYFAWHAQEGRRGYKYHDKLAAEAQTLNDQLAVTDSQRLGLQQRVSLLRPESIDPDMLDEAARAQLELAGDNDVIVLLRGDISQENP